MIYEEEIRDMLAAIRSAGTEEYYASIYAVSALLRRLGGVADPWSRDESTAISLLDEGVLCVEDGALEGIPEAHVWSRYASAVDEVLALTDCDRLYLSLSDLHPPMHGLPDAETRLREMMLHRPPGSRRREEPGLVVLSEHGPGAISCTGAYAHELAEIMLKGGGEAIALTGDDGLWRSRCRLEPLAQSVTEVCGVETNPGFKKCGWATRMLRSITPSKTSQVYLTRESNHSSTRTARAAGFRRVCSFDKFLINSPDQPE